MNIALTSIYDWRDHYNPLNQSNYKLLQEILKSKGLDENKYAVLEPIVCNNPNAHLEKRKACWVQFYINAFNANADVDTLPDINSCDSVSWFGIELEEEPSSSSSSSSSSN